MDVALDIRKANPWHFHPVFDKKRMRTALSDIGKKVTKDAKIYAVKGGEYPNKRTGALRKAIKYKVSKAGFLVKITQNMPAGGVYYPAFLIVGTKRGIRKHRSWIDTAYQSNEGWANRRIGNVLEGIDV